MAHRRGDRSSTERDAIAEQSADLELSAARRKAAALSAAFGFEPPASFDPRRWEDPGHLAALAYYAEGVAQTPAEYRGWLLGLIDEAVIEASSDPRFRAAIAAGQDFGKAVDRAWPPRRPVVYPFLEVVCGRTDWLWQEAFGRGLIPYVAYLIDDAHDRAWAERDRRDRLRDLDELGLTSSQYVWFLTGAVRDQNPCVRRAGVKWFLAYVRDSRSASLAEMAAGLLAGLLDDSDETVRRWAAVQLGLLAPHMTGIGARFWDAVCPTDDWRPIYDDIQEFIWKELRAIAPEVWQHAGPSAVPLLVDVLTDGEWRWSEILVTAAEALGRIGRVSAAALCGLEARATDPKMPETVRRAAREAFDALAVRRPEGPLAPEEQFLLTVWQDPRDEVVRLAYADWLEENDSPERARLLRLEREIARLPPEGPGRPELEAALEGATRDVDADWLRLWQSLTTRTARGGG